MSSDENISRQVHTALEYKRQEAEHFMERNDTMSNVVTREMKTNMGHLDSAKLLIRAMRRATMKRQGSKIDLHKLLQNAVESIRESNEEGNGNGDVDEESDSSLESDSSDTDSSTEIVNGEVIRKKGFKSKFQKKRKSIIKPKVKLDFHYSI